MPRCDDCETWLSKEYARVLSKHDGSLFCRNYDEEGRMIDRTLRKAGQYRDYK